jgi:hypothetical protein
MLVFYPGGVGKIERDYPGMVPVMDENCQDGDVTPVQSAVFIAGIVLSDRFENLRPADRKALRDQLARVDYGPFVEAAMRRRVQMPKGLMPGTCLAALALAMARLALDEREITEDQFKHLASEVIGALDGKSREQRSAERIGNTLIECTGVQPLTVGADHRCPGIA